MTTENYRLVSDSQWRYLHNKINYLTESVADMKSTIRTIQQPKRGLRYSEAVPPASVCRDVVSMLVGTTSYEGFIRRLSAFYDCEPMGVLRDDNVSEKYLAVYRRDEKACYSRGPSVNRKTVLHEFFHHLTNLGVVFVDKKDEEDYANRFANAVLHRAGGYSS